MRLTLLLLFIVTGTLYSQQTHETLSWENWSQAEAPSVSHFFDQLAEVKGISDVMTWKEKNSMQDALGMSHIRFQQYHLGLPVLGHEYILHAKDGKVLKSNGNVVSEVNIPMQTFVTNQEALSFAMEASPAETYAWQHHGPFFGKVRKKPQPELVIMDRAYPRFSGNYVLAYKVDIHAIQPHKREDVYINAWTGDVVNVIPTMINCVGEEADAETLYYGSKKITTTSTDSGFVLVDDSRGLGITTLRVDSSMFLDQDNYWESGSITQSNGVLDVHYGVAASYDYFFDKFQRKGIDDQDSPIYATVYTDQGVNNAFWTGEGIVIGDGDRENYGPFGAIDVCAHELTHGVTEFTSGLVYQFESGALNEGFSDIFGKAVEYEYERANFSWELGDAMKLRADVGFRNMMDPHLYECPKYYRGQYWVTGSFDNGGVHFNSGVINHWFYLLVEGGNGVDEAGLSFDVQSIGIEKATQIAYRTLTVYLTSTSQYIDARQASLEATKDLFGESCTDEFRAVAEAWQAVGVGHRIQEGDLSIMDYRTNMKVCDGKELEIQARVFNNSCQTEIAAGTELEFGYTINNSDTTWEAYTLLEAIPAGESFDYVFSNKIDLGTFGFYSLEVHLKFPDDSDPLNNARRFSVNQTEEQDFDSELLIAQLETPACNSLDGVPMTYAIIYNGCTPIQEGEEILINAEIAGQNYQVIDTLPNILFPESFYFNQVFFKDLPIGINEAEITVSLKNDPNLDDNFELSKVAIVTNSQVGYIETFNDMTMDSGRMVVAQKIPDNGIINSRLQVVDGQEVLAISGGTSSSIRTQSTWEQFRQFNAFYETIISLCFQSNGWREPLLVFDMIQTRSSYDYSSRGISDEWSNTMVVEFSGAELSQPFEDLIRNIDNDRNWSTYTYGLPVDENVIQITLSALTLIGGIDNDGRILTEDSDLILLDNVKIVEATDISNPEVNNIDIFPNPAEGIIFVVQSVDSKREITSVQAISSDGRIIELNSHFAGYDISGLTSSTYWLEVTFDDGSRLMKPLIVQN